MSRISSGIQNRIVPFTILFSAIIAIAFSLFSYYSQLEIFEEKELAKLGAVAKTLVLAIDGDEHDRLLKRYPEMDQITHHDQDSIYHKMHHLLESTMKSNMLSTNIYTMIYDSIGDRFCFGVTSAVIPYWRHKYTKFPETLRSKYKDGGKIEAYEDENGLWLSAFEPIRNSEGRVVAILQADEAFDSFIMSARKSVWKSILFSLLIISVIATVMVFTVRNLVRKQNRVALERDELETIRKELIANVSHDLRTPLASIQGYLETLLMKKDSLDPQRFEKYLRTSLSSAQRLKKLVDELFELSLLESKERKLQIESMNLGELCFDVSNNFKIASGEKGIQLKTDIPVNLPAVNADVGLIDRVLQNLISNAVKFSKSGDTIELTAKHIPEKSCVKVCVTDTGPGIHQEELPFVFNRFSRGKTNTAQGTGLGLAIVKSILELHNSKFSIQSKLNKGTSFSFELPTV